MAAVARRALMVLLLCLVQSKPALSAIEEVVVTGEQPGPQLWKAIRGDHVVWILGTVTVKPRDITWRSRQVAEVLTEAEGVIDQQLQGTTWPANIVIGVDTINPLKAIRAGGRLKDLRQAHATPPLQDVVPPGLYARFAALKRKYLPSNAQIELQRPRDAASTLFAAAVEAEGLTTRAMIHEEVHRLARKQRVKVSEVTLEMEFDIETLIAIYTEFNEVPVSAELECLEQTVTQLESDLPQMRARANAWAVGDLNALRVLPSMIRKSCDTVRWSAPRWSDLDARLESLWLDTIDAAVRKNDSTLVMLDMSEIFESDGLVAALAARGYRIEGPAQAAASAAE